MYSSTTLLLISLCLLSAQASHFPDLFAALDTLLCQNVEKRQSTIIDIKQSITLGAELLDGQWMDSMDSCVAECCGIDKCDFALFKNDGSSTSGKNCYFVSCGDSESNCIVVPNSGFTSAVIRGRKGGKEGQKNGSPLTTPPPTSTHAVTTVTPSQSTPTHPTPTTSKLPQSDTTSTPVSTPVSHAESSASTTSKPNDQNTDHNLITENSESSKSKIDSNSKAPETNAVANGKQPVNPVPTENGGSGMIAVIIVGVVCFAIVVIVVGVLAQKVWSDRRRKKFRNVDYLINGMYT